jgi:hypothetical protein
MSATAETVGCTGPGLRWRQTASNDEEPPFAPRSDRNLAGVFV